VPLAMHDEDFGIANAAKIAGFGQFCQLQICPKGVCMTERGLKSGLKMDRESVEG
jgi:hypothetical protein